MFGKTFWARVLIATLLVVAGCQLTSWVVVKPVEPAAEDHAREPLVAVIPLQADTYEPCFPDPTSKKSMFSEVSGHPTVVVPGGEVALRYTLKEEWKNASVYVDYNSSLWSVVSQERWENGSGIFVLVFVGPEDVDNSTLYLVAEEGENWDCRAVFVELVNCLLLTPSCLCFPRERQGDAEVAFVAAFDEKPYSFFANASCNGVFIQNSSASYAKTLAEGNAPYAWDIKVPVSYNTENATSWTTTAFLNVTAIDAGGSEHTWSASVPCRLFNVSLPEADEVVVPQGGKNEFVFPIHVEGLAPRVSVVIRTNWPMIYESEVITLQNGSFVSETRNVTSSVWQDEVLWVDEDIVVRTGMEPRTGSLLVQAQVAVCFPTNESATQIILEETYTFEIPFLSVTVAFALNYIRVVASGNALDVTLVLEITNETSGATETRTIYVGNLTGGECRSYWLLFNVSSPTNMTVSVLASWTEPGTGVRHEDEPLGEFRGTLSPPAYFVPENADVAAMLLLSFSVFFMLAVEVSYTLFPQYLFRVRAWLEKNRHDLLVALSAWVFVAVNGPQYVFSFIAALVGVEIPSGADPLPFIIGYFKSQFDALVIQPCQTVMWKANIAVTYFSVLSLVGEAAQPMADYIAMAGWTFPAIIIIIAAIVVASVELIAKMAYPMVLIGAALWLFLPTKELGKRLFVTFMVLPAAILAMVNVLGVVQDSLVQAMVQNVEFVIPLLGPLMVFRAAIPFYLAVAAAIRLLLFITMLGVAAIIAARR